MNCDETRKELSLFLYGELSFEKEEALNLHMGACEDCRRALEREKALHAALERNEIELPPGLLAECRRNLRQGVESEGERRRTLGAFCAAFWDSPFAGFMRPAGVLALIVAGFLAGRFIPGGEAGRQDGDSSGAGPIATEVRYVQPDPSGDVRIVLDETWQRVVSGTLEDDAIRDLLISAAKDASSPGLRVESMSILSARGESAEIRQALLQALQFDPNPGVRLKAINGLRARASEPEIRSVLTKVLLSDDNPGVRTEAIDLLVQHKNVNLAGVLQELLHKEENNYVRSRCEKTLREMNASLELF